MTTDVDNITPVELLLHVIAEAGRAAQHRSEWVSVRLLALAAILLPLAPVALIVTNPADEQAGPAASNGPIWIGGGRRGA